MKTDRRRRPELEPLETKKLLSAVALHGTIHATGHLTATSLTVSGSGNLGKVGTASISIKTSESSLPTTLTLSTKHGKLYLTETAAPTTSGTQGSVLYSIAGGTGSYVGATGSGTIEETTSLLKGNKVGATIKFV